MTEEEKKHAEENKLIFRECFSRDKDRPIEWAFHAVRLQSAAEVLFQAERECRDEDGEPIHPEHEGIEDQATMLYGFAIENALKGFFIKRYGTFEKARDSFGTGKKNSWRGHRVSEMAEATGLLLSHEQKLLLRTLDQFIRWAGRYPTSWEINDYTLEEQFECQPNLTPTALRSSTIRILKPFVDALLTELWADLPQIDLTDLRSAPTGPTAVS